ncbi:hypothetical protein RIF29_19326 [Crotalaria pallida]|uniref:Uncharacterized protein n=1 Tax=Crotalaria pallida TaxID=3830 RepID=A0AAN9F0J0_CROPI
MESKSPIGKEGKTVALRGGGRTKPCQSCLGGKRKEENKAASRGFDSMERKGYKLQKVGNVARMIKAREMRKVSWSGCRMPFLKKLAAWDSPCGNSQERDDDGVFIPWWRHRVQWDRMRIWPLGL